MKLLPKTIQAARGCASLTAIACAQCPEQPETRCCSALFCELTAAGLRALELPEPGRPGRFGIPFLGEAGCVVAPEHRPFCATFVCPAWLEADRVGEFTRRVSGYRERVWADPAAEAMRSAGHEAVSGLPEWKALQGKAELA